MPKNEGPRGQPGENRNPDMARERNRERGRSTERCRNGKSKITRDTGCTQPAETKKEKKKKKKSTIKF